MNVAAATAQSSLTYFTLTFLLTLSTYLLGFTYYLYFCMQLSKNSATLRSTGKFVVWILY